MVNLDLKSMFTNSNEELKKASAIKVYLLKLEEISPSEENPYSINEENIDSLATNIEEYGLFQAITVQKEGSLNKIVSGERRYTALKKLFEEGKKYSYNNEDITGYIPVSFIHQTIGSTKTMLMISANAHRDLQKDEKNKIIDTTLEILINKEKIGRFSWEGKRKAAVISSITGIKEHYIKEYLAEKNNQEKDLNTKSQKKIQEISEEEKNYRALVNKITACLKLLDNFDNKIIKNKNEKVQDEFFKKCSSLSVSLQKLIN